MRIDGALRTLTRLTSRTRPDSPKHARPATTASDAARGQTPPTPDATAPDAAGKHRT
jgi:hypothetical protein